MAHRLFVGIDPPDAVKDACVAIMDGVDGARWQTDEQLHLTLRFLDTLDGGVAEDVAELLAGVRAAPFPLALAGVGVFERKGRVETLWAGARPVDAVTALHHKVDRAVMRAGVAADPRAYRPHVTLARFSRGSGSLAGFLAAHADLRTAEWVVDAFHLYESRLGAGGSVYEIVATYPLG